MHNTLMQTQFSFPNQTNVYKGKVRDVYTINDSILVMIATDRLSAFDVVLPRGIPYKGQILNQIATTMMKATEDLVPNWLMAAPDPNVAVGYLCKPFKIEMVIRGYLSGHAARLYKAGNRKICGISMPEGMLENDRFYNPIITPATKAEKGNHDEDISKKEIIDRGLVNESDYQILEDYTELLFKKGTALAAKQGLILVDTKYEFGKTKDGKIVLIDEIHTPDSSRYLYADGYNERQNKGEPQKQLSKEFVRQWLIKNNFQGKEGQTVPKMSKKYVQIVSSRYIELYESITGKNFVKANNSNIIERIQKNVLNYLKSH